MYELLGRRATPRRRCDIHYGLHPLVDLLFVETNPAPIKWVLAQRGLIASGYVRPPLVTPTDAGPGPHRRAARRGRPMLDEPLAESHGNVADRAETVAEDLPSTIRHYIGGELVDSVDGDARSTSSTRSTNADLRAGAPPARPPTSTAPSTAAGPRVRRRPWAAAADPRARPSVLHRIADVDRGAATTRLAALESFDTGLPITQAHGPGPARRGELPVLRRRDRRAVRGRLPVPARPAQLRHPQADGRRRAHHAVEHAVHAGDVEARARRSPPAARSCSSPPSSRRCRRACGRRSSRRRACPPGVFNIVHGVGEEAGDALVDASRRAADLVHGRDRDRQADHSSTRRRT